MIPVSVVAGAVLVLIGRSAPTRLAGATFALSVTAMLVTSALFNRRWWSDRAWRTMRQIDQTGIWLLIGGTYTALLGVTSEDDVRIVPLAVFWVGIALGTVARWLPGDMPKGLQSGLFVVLSWYGAIDLARSADDLGARVVTLALVGGLLYLAGVLVLGFRRPDPWPRTFGYHEIWHVMVVAALVLHFVAAAEVLS